MEKINSIKDVSQQLVDEKDAGLSLDRKEILNLALTTKRLMERYDSVLNELLRMNLTSEERENIDDILEQTGKAMISLDDSIDEVKKRKS